MTTAEIRKAAEAILRPHEVYEPWARDFRTQGPTREERLSALNTLAICALADRLEKP